MLQNGSLADFRDRVSVDLRAKVTLSQVKRAKRKAISLLDGDIKDQFKMMWDYCNEMDRTNPRSTIRMKFTDNEGPMYGTQLLSAVETDGNNNIFPISHAIVEKENKETWTWFLTYLASDLDKHEDEASWTFMSDKQKDFGSFSLKKALWAAAKATTVQQFVVCMNHMFELDPNIVAWLYNSMILDARDEPILTVLEKLRYLLMARMLANREKAEQWNLGASIMDNWAVHLEKRTCSCRKWSLTGIPCKHAIAAIWANQEDTLDYVHDSYKVRRKCSEVQQENMKQREVGQEEEMNSSWKNS
ncbi:hypothetical protein KY284_007544 [Solanum tuberosum]|nr:hypothetical protein KY284_007544 [Solanum tuberosum]